MFIITSVQMADVVAGLLGSFVLSTTAPQYVFLTALVKELRSLLPSSSQEHPGSLTEPILAAAGTDISHWYST